MNRRIIKMREILANMNLGEKLDSGKDYDYILEILKGHPNYIKKIGKGVSYFKKEKNRFGKYYLKLKRKDGSSTDFSYYKCFYKPTKRTELIKIFRKLIEPQILEFRKNYRNLIVHHENPTFKEIFEKWEKINNINIEKIKLIRKDNQFLPDIEDEKIIYSFINYHKKVANLLLVTKEEHKRIHKE